MSTFFSLDCPWWKHSRAGSGSLRLECLVRCFSIVWLLVIAIIIIASTKHVCKNHVHFTIIDVYSALKWREAILPRRDELPHQQHWLRWNWTGFGEGIDCHAYPSTIELVNLLSHISDPKWTGPQSSAALAAHLLDQPSRPQPADGPHVRLAVCACYRYFIAVIMSQHDKQRFHSSFP